MPYLFFILGLLVGSFLNSLIYRLGKKELKKIWTGRSFCPHCKKTLKWFDLIPLISFLIQKGKCRYCRKPISLQYPLVEFFTGLLFFLLFWKFGLSYSLLLFLPITSLLIILFVYDLKTQTIPDLVAYIAIGLALVYSIFNFQFFTATTLRETIFNLISAVSLAVFFALLVYLSKEYLMGKGDIKMGLLLGLTLGFPKILVGAFFAFFLGALVGLILIALKKKNLKSQIPFGPFLILGIFIGLFFGEKIINWYLGLLP